MFIIKGAVGSSAVTISLGWETASSHPSYKWVEQQALSQGVTAGQSSILFLPMGRKLFGI